MIKAVVFDLDDTLISEREYVKSGFKAVSREIKNLYDLDKDKVNKKLNELFELDRKNVFNRLFEFYNLNYEKKEILHLIKIYREHEPEISFFEDVIPTLNELKKRGYKLGIITDGYKESQRKKIEVLGCKEIFDEIIITDELGREFWKPHEKAYKLMAKKLFIENKEMIYIGDNPNKDFVTANKLEIKTILINRENCIYLKKVKNEKFSANLEIKKFQEIILNLDE